MARRRSMRTQLILAFSTVTIVPILIAAVAGIWAFQDSMRAEAERLSAEHMRIEQDMAAERMQRKAALIASIASSNGVVDAVARGRAVPKDALGKAANAAGLTYILAVDTSGRVVGASKGPVEGGFKNDPLVFNAVVGRAGSGFMRLDPAELKRRGLADDTGIEVKATAGGTVRHAKLDGALAMVAATPLVGADGSAQGALVGFEVLNRSTAFVDDVVKRIGGTATIFQDEVRISTTVRTAKGERAWGTVASDPVQNKVLSAGAVFHGVANVVGKPHQATYVPLDDTRGERIGMLYVGFPTDPYVLATRLFGLRYLGAAAVGLMLAWAAAVWGAQVLSRPLMDVGLAADAVSQRDLTVTAPIAGTNETAALGDAFNTMVRQLSAVLSHASEVSSKMRGIAEELRSQSDLQADSANRQASAVAETTATLEELAATFGAVAAGAEQVMRLAEDAVEAAEQGRSTVDASQNELERLFVGAEQVASAADGVEQASAEIESAVGLIESVAGQTKILALNAAIEASRAGAAGRGFAVVAQEIRQLAESVSDSTAHIEQVVKRIQASTSGLTGVSREQNKLAEKSVELGRQTAGSFADIADQLVSTAAAARQIAAAAVQQRTATAQVVEAMHQVSTSSRDTAEVARGVARAAQLVQESGVELDEDLRRFKV